MYLLYVASILLHCIDTLVGDAMGWTAVCAQPWNLTEAGKIYIVLAVNCMFAFFSSSLQRQW